MLTSAGCKLHIGTTAKATDLAEFKADSYKEVGDIEDLGEFGDEFSAVTAATLNDARLRKGKGTADAGDMSLVVLFNGSDAGQAALAAAAADTTSNAYNIKVTLNDQITPETGNPTTFYFRALVMSNRIAVGGSDNAIRRNVGLAITSEILEEEVA